MDAHKQSINLRALWDSRTRRGLLPVLDEMNDLLSRGLITDEDFQSCFSQLDAPPPAEDLAHSGSRGRARRQKKEREDEAARAAAAAEAEAEAEA